MSLIQVGDPAPWFHCRGQRSPSWSLSHAAGRVVVLSYLGSGAIPAARAIHAGFQARPDLFDGRRALHLTVVCDPRDERDRRLSDAPPGSLLLWDLDQRVARQLGLIGEGAEGRPTLFTASIVLDPALRVLGIFPIRAPEAHVEQVLGAVQAALTPPSEAAAVTGGVAPVLMAPRLLDPPLCQALIAHFQRGQPVESGVVHNAPDGGAQTVVDHGRKRRLDLPILDPELLAAVHGRLAHRLLPEIERAFCCRVTRAERYIIGCYRAESGGHFAAHRDNTGATTEHRRFALTINLNAEGYEGGDLSFPEYGPQRYRAPTGGGVVFSCSLMHEVHPVTRGDRYCVVPFLYDEEGERVRRRHLERGADSETRVAVIPTYRFRDEDVPGRAGPRDLP